MQTISQHACRQRLGRGQAKHWGQLDLEHRVVCGPSILRGGKQLHVYPRVCMRQDCRILPRVAFRPGVSATRRKRSRCPQGRSLPGGRHRACQRPWPKEAHEHGDRSSSPHAVTGYAVFPPCAGDEVAVRVLCRTLVAVKGGNLCTSRFSRPRGWARSWTALSCPSGRGVRVGSFILLLTPGAQCRSLGRPWAQELAGVDHWPKDLDNGSVSNRNTAEASNMQMWTMP